MLEAKTEHAFDRSIESLSTLRLAFLTSVFSDQPVYKALELFNHQLLTLDCVLEAISFGQSRLHFLQFNILLAVSVDQLGELSLSVLFLLNQEVKVTVISSKRRQLSVSELTLASSYSRRVIWSRRTVLSFVFTASLVRSSSEDRRKAFW